MTFLAPITTFGILDTLIARGDAQTTTQNIAAGQGLFRVAIALFFVTAVLDVVVGWAVYVVSGPSTGVWLLLRGWATPSIP